MDPRKDHLPYALIREAPDLGHAVLQGPGLDPSPDIGDDAVGAELVAAVLDLDKGPGMAIQLRNEEVPCLRGGFFRVPLRIRLCPFLFREKLLQDQLRDPALVPVRYQEVNGGIPQDRLHAFVLHGGVHITACRNDEGLRIQLLCPMKHLAGFLVRHIGDRTGIDDVDIRWIRKGDLQKSRLSQGL